MFFVRSRDIAVFLLDHRESFFSGIDQVYVQDSDLTVAKYVEKVAKENGANMTVKKFVRFETGEGLEKKNEDFAAEVAAQMNA